MSEDQKQDQNDRNGQNGDTFLASSQSMSDPYAILKVERDADDDTIQRSYKRLSRTFHPDKQPPGLARDAAQDVFIAFKGAHDILTDPVQRQAFDNHGRRGLEVVKRSMHEKHPDALYATLLKLHQAGQKQEARQVLKEALQYLEFEVQNRNVRFSSSMEFPCTTVSTQFLGEGDEAVTVPELQGAHISFAVTSSSRVDSKWSVTMGGTTNVVNGKGDTSGQLSLGYKPVQDTHVNVDLDVNDPYKAAVGTTRRFSNGTVVTTKMSTIPKSKNLSLLFMSQRTLFNNNYVGTCAFAMGTDLTLQLYQLSFTTLWNKWPQMTVKFKLGDQHPITLSMKREFGSHPQHKHTAHASCALGQSSVEVKAIVDHALSSYATWSIGIQHASLSGLTWILGIQRGDVSFRIPILVSTIHSPGYSYKLLLLTFMSVLWHREIREEVEDTASKIVLDDRSKDETANKTRSLRQESSWMELDKSKRDAEQQAELMKKMAEMSKETETAKNGLVILQATYFIDGGETMDASIQLQFWVKNSTLKLPPTPKSHLLGFYSLTAAMDDPNHEKTNAWWKPLSRFLFRSEESPNNKERPLPKLTVRYQTGGKVYEVTVVDDEELILPHPNALLLGDSDVVS